MNLSQRGEPELESQSIAALGPDVLGFLSACNRKLNGMSVWCGLCLVSFLTVLQMWTVYLLQFVSFY